MEMILTLDKKKEILHYVEEFLEKNLNKNIEIPIIIDPPKKEEELSQREKFRLFSEMMEREGPVWTDENHPDLKTLEDIENYSRALRKQWDRINE
jgi:hypothetical protein